MATMVVAMEQASREAAMSETETERGIDPTLDQPLLLYLEVEAEEGIEVIEGDLLLVERDLAFVLHLLLTMAALPRL